VEGADLLRIARRIDGAEVVFLAYPSPEPVTVTVRGDGVHRLAIWNPVTLRREALRSDRLDLPPLGSAFLLPSGPVDDASPATAEELPLDHAWRLTLPGVLETALPSGPREWTELGDAPAGFAGVGSYATSVDVGAVGSRAVLALGEIGDLARVRVNGVDCGVVWTAPWEIDVTAALRPGRNEIEVDVANAWMNRLIAEAGRPTGEIFAPVAAVYGADAPQQRCGLAGPVVLRVSP
jgi:hypothetical protein